MLFYEGENVDRSLPSIRSLLGFVDLCPNEREIQHLHQRDDQQLSVGRANL